MTGDHHFDQAQLREAFGLFPSGVAAIAAQHNHAPHVIVASSFSVGVSLQPPLAAFFVQKHSSTWRFLQHAERLGVSILSYEHAQICRQLAGQDKNQRFEGVDYHVTATGAIQLAKAPIWFECSIYDVHPAGDHLSVQLLIQKLNIQKDTTPLVYHQSRFFPLGATTTALSA